MSPRRFDGWEPAEFRIPREGDDGAQYVEVIREPEWSDKDREEAEALMLCEALTCKGCGCWLPESAHESFVALVDDATCYGCRSLAVVQRDTERKHKEDPNPAPGRPGWMDGLRMSVRPATAAEAAGRVRPE